MPLNQATKAGTNRPMLKLKNYRDYYQQMAYLCDHDCSRFAAKGLPILLRSSSSCLGLAYSNLTYKLNISLFGEP